MLISNIVYTFFQGTFTKISFSICHISLRTYTSYKLYFSYASKVDMENIVSTVVEWMMVKLHHFIFVQEIVFKKFARKVGLLVKRERDRKKKDRQGASKIKKKGSEFYKEFICSKMLFKIIINYFHKFSPSHHHHRHQHHHWRRRSMRRIETCVKLYFLCTSKFKRFKVLLLK